MKHTLYSITGACGIHRISASIHRHRPIILTFHGVTSDRTDSICNADGLHIHLPIFERLMAHVARNYRVVPLARIVDWLEGNASAPERAVAVTFDDGFRNVLTDAAPVLERLDIPSTLFVSTDFVFNRDMLWPDRLAATLATTRERSLDVLVGGETRAFNFTTREGKLHAHRELVALCKTIAQDERLALIDQIVERLNVAPAQLQSAWEGLRPIEPEELERLPEFGITVGAHTCSHPILAKLPASAQARELSESKRLLESVTGVRCDQFAYPNGAPGDFSDQTRSAIIDAGYRCAFTTIKRRVTDRDDRFEIPRCTLTHNHISLTEFSAEVSGTAGTLRGLRDRVRGVKHGHAAAPHDALRREGIA